MAWRSWPSFFTVRFLEARSMSFHCLLSCALQSYSSSVSGASAAFHDHALSRWSTRGHHVPRWFICVGLRVMATNRLFCRVWWF
jgi:hypothetical protein